MQVSCGAVYSLHKSSTRAHIKRTADKELHAASSEVLAQLRFNLPASYAFHKYAPFMKLKEAQGSSRDDISVSLRLHCPWEQCPGYGYATALYNPL